VRILHVVPTYHPATRYGGPIVSVHELCAALARRGHDVHVFTTNVDGPRDSDVPIGRPVVLDGVSVWYFGVPSLRRIYWSPSMGAALDAKAGAFSVVHTHSVFLWPTWAAARQAVAHAVPYVVSPRGMLVKRLIDQRSAFAKRAWIRLIERRNLARASAVHATSEAEMSDMQHLGLELPPIRVIPNGVGESAEAAAVTQSVVPRELDTLLRSQVQLLLCLGRIMWKKGIDRVVRALVAVPEAHLVVVGTDEDGYTDVLRLLARELGVERRVHIFGPLFGAAKQHLYREADLFVLASHSENFGNVVLEAMAQGCPVVVTPEVGAAPIVTESGAGIVSDGEPESLAASISQLLSDHAARNRMGTLGRQAVAQRFGWDHVASQMESLYASIVSGEGTRT
jgi:glycosyltransferase involved in cell wall biosynthesis